MLIFNFIFAMLLFLVVLVAIGAGVYGTVLFLDWLTQINDETNIEKP